MGMGFSTTYMGKNMKNSEFGHILVLPIFLGQKFLGSPPGFGFYSIPPYILPNTISLSSALQDTSFGIYSYILENFYILGAQTINHIPPGLI